MAPRPNPLHLYGDRRCLEHAGAYESWSCGECAHLRLSQAVSLEYIDFQMGLSDGKAPQHGRDGSDPEEMGLNFAEDDTQGNLRPQRLFEAEAMAEYIDFQMGIHPVQAAAGLDAEEIIPFAIAARAETDDRGWLQKEPPWICPQEIALADCWACLYNPGEHRI